MLLRDKENNRRHHLDQIKQRSENRSNVSLSKLSFVRFYWN